MSSEIFEVTDGKSDRAVIRVIGVGGGGCNTVNQMVEASIEGVDFICANTDRQHLERCKTTAILQLGAGITRGLGAGSNPEVGRQAALEDKDRIRELVEGTDLLFITAGMGGGTGTGGAPVIAEIARDLGILTVAVVTKPFMFEQKKRMNAAIKGIEDLERFVDSLILIPNEKLLLVMGEDAEADACFKAANDVLQNAVQGISDVITRPGQINLDFADVKTVMQNRGKAMMGMGSAKGDDRAMKAVEAALASPLLDDLELSNARGILLSMSCDRSLKMGEMQKINMRVQQIAHDDCDFKFGTSLDTALDGEMRVTVVATGLGGAKMAAHDSKVVPLQAPVRKATLKEITEVPAIDRTPAQAKKQPAKLDDLVYDENLLDIPAFLRAQAD